MVRRLVRLFRDWDESGDFPLHKQLCLFSRKLYHSAGLLSPHRPGKGGNAGSPSETSWQAQGFLLCDKSSPDYLRALVGVHWSFGVESPPAVKGRYDDGQNDN